MAYDAVIELSDFNIAVPDFIREDLEDRCPQIDLPSSWKQSITDERPEVRDIISQYGMHICSASGVSLGRVSDSPSYLLRPDMYPAATDEDATQFFAKRNDGIHRLEHHRPYDSDEPSSLMVGWEDTLSDQTLSREDKLRRANNWAPKRK